MVNNNNNNNKIIIILSTRYHPSFYESFFRFSRFHQITTAVLCQYLPTSDYRRHIFLDSKADAECSRLLTGNDMKSIDWSNVQDVASNMLGDVIGRIPHASIDLLLVEA